LNYRIFSEALTDKIRGREELMIKLSCSKVWVKLKATFGNVSCPMSQRVPGPFYPVFPALDLRYATIAG